MEQERTGYYIPGVLENRENSFLRPHVLSIMARPARARAVGFPLFRFHNKKTP